MNIYFAKPSVSIDFINVVVKRTHTKSKQYIQGVAKIPECCKIITQLIRKILNCTKSAIIIYYRKITISNHQLSIEKLWL